MKRAKEILDPKDYANYRHIRAIAVMYMVLAVLFLILGAAIAFVPLGKGAKTAAYIIEYVFSALVTLLGIAGIFGAISVFRGDRKWSPLVLLVAGFYFAMFPIGTFLSIIFFKDINDITIRLIKSKPQIVQCHELAGIAGRCPTFLCSRLATAARS